MKKRMILIFSIAIIVTITLILTCIFKGNISLKDRDSSTVKYTTREHINVPKTKEIEVQNEFFNMGMHFTQVNVNH